MLKKLYVLTFCLVAATANARADEFVFHHEHVLGTNLELRVEAASKLVAIDVEQVILDEIDRLSSILSGYDSNSEFSKWQSNHSTGFTNVSPELGYVLNRAEHWRTQTEGAFDLRVAELGQFWKQHLGRTAASSQQRHSIVAQLAHAPYGFSNGKIKRNDRLSMSLDGLAKGFVLDSICELVEQNKDITGFTINIGGDLRKMGAGSLLVSILDPLEPHGAKAHTTISLDQSASIATSGGYFRNIEYKGKRYSHIFDPRTGLPVETVASVTVMSEKAVDADALATSISVLGIDRGLSLIESLVSAECLIISNRGECFASSGWPAGLVQERQQHSKKTEPTKADDSKEKLTVNFTLNRPKGRRYRRPYVAVWLEDGEGFPVKTGLLFLQTERPGPRWHRDLTRWYRNDRTRRLVEKTDLIGTISSATRGPGKYSAQFDGTDNQGNKLADGEYTLFLEVAREHGTYQIIREQVKLIAGSPIAKTRLKSNVEVSDVYYSFEKQVPKEKGRPAEKTSEK